MKDYKCSMLMWVGALALVAILGLLVAFPLQFAWNETMPAIFGLPVITFWQAYLLVWVKTILITGNPVQHHSHKD